MVWYAPSIKPLKGCEALPTVASTLKPSASVYIPAMLVICDDRVTVWGVPTYIFVTSDAIVAPEMVTVAIAFTIVLPPPLNGPVYVADDGVGVLPSVV